MSDPDETTDDRIGRRTTGSRVREWVLLGGDRLWLAAALLGAVFVALLALGMVAPVPLREAVAGSDPVETLFQGLLTAIITGVTLVVSINQLVLSQELGAVGDQRQRMTEAMQFRRDAEALLDDAVAPPAPAAFLAALLSTVRSRAAAVDDAVGQGSPARDAVETFVEEMDHSAAGTADKLADARFGSFDVVGPVLSFDYSLYIVGARRLRARVEDDDADGALADLVDVLELFGPAREHFKTLYFQWALIDLSRAVLYAAVPALVVSAAMILYGDAPGAIPGSVLGVDVLLLVVVAAATVGLAPFAVLLSYILRIVTVAKRTLAIGPFVLGDADDGPVN